MGEENSCRKSTEFGTFRLPRKVTSKKRADGRRALDVPGNRKSKSAVGKWSMASNVMLVLFCTWQGFVLSQFWEAKQRLFPL